MTNCLLCGTQTRFLFSTRDYIHPEDQAEYRLNWCDACDFGRLDGNFTSDQIASFYPLDYYTHSTTSKPFSAQSILERLRVHLAWRVDDGVQFDPSEIGVGKTVCDLGCGNGNDLRLFKQSGYQSTGVDPDPIARDAAKDAGNILAGTAEILPAELKGTNFDVVLMSHVLEHCIDPSKAIANARGLLAQNGTLVIEVPNNDARGFAIFKSAWPWSDIPRHINFFTEKSLIKLFDRNGLTISKTLYVGYTRQFTSSWISTQRHIFSAINGNSHQPNFDLEAWLLLYRTAFSRPKYKFDSIRVLASRRQS